MGGDRHSADKVAKFSPRSNDQPTLMDSEQTCILIATDVIAEGQNLQDCNRVVSYDLHWNPVTLIQRHGRVDRITTEHEEIYLHNMMPDPAVEGAIGIRGTLGNRVQAFHDLIGLDNVVLENGERVNPESIYAIYDGEMPEERDDVTDSLAVAQQANALLNRTRREQPELWQRLWLMPDSLRAAMTKEEHHNAESTIVLVADGDTKQGYAVNSDGDIAELTHAKLVRQVECEPDTPTAPLPLDTNARVSAAGAALAELLSPKPTQLEPRQRDDQVARYINTQLGQLRLDDQADANYLRDLEGLRVAFNAELPTSVNEKIRTLMHEKAEGRRLADALAAMVPELPKLDNGPEPRRPIGNIPRIVCSMGIVAT